MSWQNLQNKKSNKSESTEIDKIFTSVFNQVNGKKVIEYLESITINSICTPQASDSTLWHLEGQRYLLQIIKSKIKRGTKNE
jgi:hypothetical protein|tara:strand:+ start:429 stop:674 length:246 start_codon:yes stop_codon:yes gene_type:complete